MVYKGPSRGCQTCRRRRVKCDEVRPQCGNCIKRKLPCPGYRDLFDTYHKDETLTIASKRPKTKSPCTTSSAENIEKVPETPCPESLGSRSPRSLSASNSDQELAIWFQPSRNMQWESLCYFIANYVNIPRDPTTNIFIEHVLPLYLGAPVKSALSQAMTAVAIQVAQTWMSPFAESYASREAYGRAVATLRAALQDPASSKTDDTLAAVYMLDFHDSLQKRFVDFVDTGTHQQGAIALLRHRGQRNFDTLLSQRLFVALRSRHINYCLEFGRPVQLDVGLLNEAPAILPSAKLDLLKAELTTINAFVQEGPEVAGMGLVDFYQAIMQRALRLDKSLNAWRQSLPKSWHPVAVPASDLHPSIKAAGLYNDMCDVYSSLAVSHTHNASRSTHIGALRLVALCSSELESLGIAVEPGIEAYVKEQVQEIADRFCASVPFHLGNRTTLTRPNQYMEYPPIPLELRRLASYVDSYGNPVEMTMEDHIRAAAAIGGFFLLTPVRGFIQGPRIQFTASDPRPLVKHLRKGQAEWIQGQVQRIQKIYLHPRNFASSPAELPRWPV